MAKKYIFMTGKYMPTPGATGVCIHALAKYLVNQGEDVMSICYEDNSGMNEIDGVKVCRINAPSYFFDKQYHSRFEQVKDVWTSRLMKLVHMNKYPLRSTKLLRAYKNNCLEFLKSVRQEDATIIATYTPLEAVASLIEIKKELPKVKVIYYSADTLSNEQGNNGLLSPEKREQMGRKWEHSIFDICDLIFVMECHKEHYFGEDFRAYKDKMLLVNFPLMNEPIHKSVESKKSIVFAGTLLRELRNPQFACNTLLEALKEIDYEAVFMGSGDCDDIVNNAVEKSNGKIKFLGMQPYAIASEYIASAGVLLSIGNAESPMMPSKIYEYMATGKPIIHFYTWDRDSCLEPLKKYGNTLLVKQTETINVNEIVSFILRSRTVSVDDVFTYFKTSTPGYTVTLINS